MNSYLEINEIFGPTIQGEGSAAGQHCLFIRLFGCNLECRWCDTPETWAVTAAKAARTDSGKVYVANEQRFQMTSDMILTELMMRWDIVNKPTLIVVSGGEPMIQRLQLAPLTRHLFDLGNRIHIETAGTIKTTPELDLTVQQYNVSPKLEHSGNAFKKRYKPDALANLMHTGKAHFKFVVQSTKDFPEIDFLVKELDIPRSRVTIMPEGTNVVDNVRVAQDVIDAATRAGYNLSFRSHILIWGNKKGV